MGSSEETPTQKDSLPSSSSSIDSMAAIGWYGPLIDLARAGSHVDDLVQLLVFVHRLQPVVIQKSNTSNGGTSVKTKIQVSDDTRTYFSVSLWPKHMGSTVAAGDIILLQNVKIVKFRNVLEATTAQVSLLLTLVRSHELDAFEDLFGGKCSLELDKYKGIDKLMSNTKLGFGGTTREKLKRVVDWVWHTESALQHVQQVDSSKKKLMNWKTDEKEHSKSCSSISEILETANSCNVKFYASTSGVFLPPTWISSEVEMDPLLFNKSLVKMVDSKILEYLIGTGCKLCGSPIVSRNIMDENKIPLYCPNSSNYIHNVCIIYRPFMLEVWDKTGQIPILVKNKAAEILFGNIRADMVYGCYQEESKKLSNRWHIPNPSDSTYCHKRQKGIESKKKLNFYQIWLIMLKLLLQQGEKNSPFQFEITVDREKDLEAGRFELISLTMP